MSEAIEVYQNEEHCECGNFIPHIDEQTSIMVCKNCGLEQYQTISNYSNYTSKKLIEVINKPLPSVMSLVKKGVLNKEQLRIYNRLKKLQSYTFATDIVGYEKGIKFLTEMGFNITSKIFDDIVYCMKKIPTKFLNLNYNKGKEQGKELKKEIHQILGQKPKNKKIQFCWNEVIFTLYYYLYLIKEFYDFDDYIALIREYNHRFSARINNSILFMIKKNVPIIWDRIKIVHNPDFKKDQIKIMIRKQIDTVVKIESIKYMKKIYDDMKLSSNFKYNKEKETIDNIKRYILERSERLIDKVDLNRIVYRNEKIMSSSIIYIIAKKYITRRNIAHDTKITEPTLSNVSSKIIGLVKN